MPVVTCCGYGGGTFGFGGLGEDGYGAGGLVDDHFSFDAGGYFAEGFINGEGDVAQGVDGGG